MSTASISYENRVSVNSPVRFEGWVRTASNAQGVNGTFSLVDISNRLPPFVLCSTIERSTGSCPDIVAGSRCYNILCTDRYPLNAPRGTTFKPVFTYSYVCSGGGSCPNGGLIDQTDPLEIIVPASLTAVTASSTTIVRPSSTAATAILTTTRPVVTTSTPAAAAASGNSDVPVAAIGGGIAGALIVVGAVAGFLIYRRSAASRPPKRYEDDVRNREPMTSSNSTFPDKPLPPVIPSQAAASASSSSFAMSPQPARAMSPVEHHAPPSTPPAVFARPVSPPQAQHHMPPPQETRTPVLPVDRRPISPHQAPNAVSPRAMSPIEARPISPAAHPASVTAAPAPQMDKPAFDPNYGNSAYDPKITYEMSQQPIDYGKNGPAYGGAQQMPAGYPGYGYGYMGYTNAPAQPYGYNYGGADYYANAGGYPGYYDENGGYHYFNPADDPRNHPGYAAMPQVMNAQAPPPPRG